jgi:pimeloyl-ACP methyl ester carboxylesterase
VLRHVTAPDGVRIACEVSGEGPPLVLVHGAGSARWAFDLLRPHLERRFTVIALDRRGRGSSSDNDAWALEREYEDVAAVMRDAGEDALLFGHSYGGLVAGGAAALLDGLPRLVLYEPAIGPRLADPAAIDRWERLLAAGEREQMVREFLRDTGGYSHEEIDAMRATPTWAGRLEAARCVARELRAARAVSLDGDPIAEIEAPTLLLLGTESPEWANRSVEAFARALRDATARRLEGQGHGATTAAPELLAAEIVRFLGQPDGA